MLRQPVHDTDEAVLLVQVLKRIAIVTFQLVESIHLVFRKGDLRSESTHALELIMPRKNGQMLGRDRPSSLGRLGVDSIIEWRDGKDKSLAT